MALEETKTWPELAIGLYDKLTGRDAEITYEFDNFDLYVPSKASGNGEADHAHWKMNGTIRVRTTDNKKG